MVVRAITVRPAALLHMTSNIIVLRRPSLCSPTQTLSCSQVVTPAGQNNNTYCQITLILMYYDDHRGMPRLAIFPAHLWRFGRIPIGTPMTFKRLYYEDRRCVTPLKTHRAPIW